MEFSLVLRRNFLNWKSHWLPSSLAIVFEPVIYLVGLGFGLSSIVEIQGFNSYIQFVFPALLIVLVMVKSFTESTYSLYGRIYSQGIYQTMNMAGLKPETIARGEIIWGAIYSSFSGLVLILLALVMGLIKFEQLPLLVLSTGLCAILFSSVGAFITGNTARSQNYALFFTLVILPAALLGQTFFPVAKFSVVLDKLSLILPTTHFLAILRPSMVGELPAEIFLHLALMFVFAGLAFHFGAQSLSQRVQLVMNYSESSISAVGSSKSS